MLEKNMFKKKFLRKTSKNAIFLLFFNIWTVNFDHKKAGFKK